MESERLARRWFEAARAPDFPRRVKVLLHPEITVTLDIHGGGRLTGADAVCEFLDERVDAGVYEPVDERYHPLDDERVIVEGRLRWMDDSRTLRDDPAIWAVEFREGLVYRSITVRSLSEAEAVLGSRSADDV